MLDLMLAAEEAASHGDPAVPPIVVGAIALAGLEPVWERAVALVSFPGGLGTLDELFEVLTLTQTGKIRRRPIILIGRDFWQRLIDFEVLVEHGVISPADVNLFHYAETAEEAWDAIKAAYSGDNPSLTARQLRGN